MKDYIKNKLSLKLNLYASSGAKRNGVISDRVIDSLVKEIDGLGKYEIIYKGNFPISINKLEDDYKAEYRNGKYYLTLFNTTTGIDANQFIEFNIKEYRDIQLKKFYHESNLCSR